MNWITQILGLLKSLMGFGEKIAENKAIKLPHQIESIESESKKDAQKDYLKIGKRKDKEIKEMWIARVKLLELKIRYRRDALSDVRRLVEAGYEITEIHQYGKGYIIDYLYNGEPFEIKVE